MQQEIYQAMDTIEDVLKNKEMYQGILKDGILSARDEQKHIKIKNIFQAIADISYLKENERYFLEKKYFEEVKREDIAKSLCVSVRTVGNMRERVLKKIGRRACIIS